MEKKLSTPPPKMLNDGQIRRLIMSLAVHRDEKGFEEKETEKLVKWAEWSLLQAEIVKMVIKGLVFADMTNTNAKSFDDMTFTATSMVLNESNMSAYLDMLDKAENRNNETASV